MLYDALPHLGYNRDVSDGQPDGAIDGNRHRVELDDTIEQTTQVTLTSLCGSRLADTVTMSIVLFPVHYRGDPVWQQRLEAIFGPEVPHFHAGMTVMAKYAQSLFNL
jgi:hypothetical protein